MADLVEGVYDVLLKRLEDWETLNLPARQEILRLSSCFMGRPFLDALYQLEQNHSSLQISRNTFVTIVSNKKQKAKLFLNKGKWQCTCKISWERQCGKPAPKMCCHELICHLASNVTKNVAICPSENPNKMLRDLLTYER